MVLISKVQLHRSSLELSVKSRFGNLYGWLSLFIVGSFAYPLFTVDDYWIGGQIGFSLIVAVYLLVFKFVMWVFNEDPIKNDWLPAAYPIGIGITFLALNRMSEPCGLITNLLSGKLRC